MVGPPFSKKGGKVGLFGKARWGEFIGGFKVGVIFELSRNEVGFYLKNYKRRINCRVK